MTKRDAINGISVKVEIKFSEITSDNLPKASSFRKLGLPLNIYSLAFFYKNIS